MGQLEVFDTRGNRIHPTKDETDSSIASYFERFVFGMTTEAAEPQLESYARMVLGEGGREQVFIRYTGDASSTLVRDCREAVQRELLDERGWRLVEHDGPSDPRALFYTLMKGSTPTGGQSTLTDWFRSLVQQPEYAKIATNWLESDDNTPIKVYGRDYETIAGVIPRFLDSSVHVFVGRSSSRERSKFQSTSDDEIDIELLPDSRRTNRREFSLHPDTEDQFEMRWEEQRENIRQEKYGTILATIRELSDLGTDADDVRRNIDQALQQEYPSIRVTSQHQQDGFEQGLDPEGGSANGGSSPQEMAIADDDSGRFGWLNRKKGLAVSLTFFVVLAVLGVAFLTGLLSTGLIPGLSGGGGDDGITMNGNTIVISGAVGNQGDGTNVSIFEKSATGKTEKAQLNFSNTTNETVLNVSVSGENRTIHESQLNFSNNMTETIVVQDLDSGVYVVEVTAPDNTVKTVEIRIKDGATTTSTTSANATTTATNGTTSTTANATALTNTAGA